MKTDFTLMDPPQPKLVKVYMYLTSAEIEQNFIDCFNDGRYVKITSLELNGHFKGEISQSKLPEM